MGQLEQNVTKNNNQNTDSLFICVRFCVYFRWSLANFCVCVFHNDDINPYSYCTVNRTKQNTRFGLFKTTKVSIDTEYN